MLTTTETMIPTPWVTITIVETDETVQREDSLSPLLPDQDQMAQDSTLNGLWLAGIAEVTDLLPVVPHCLRSHGLISLSDNGSKSPLPAH